MVIYAITMKGKMSLDLQIASVKITLDHSLSGADHDYCY